MDNPEKIYNSIKKMHDIDKLVKLRQREHLFLEFKRTDVPMSSTDKKNLSQVVSGFANSGGGVIIWGVGTGERTERNQAISKQLISDVNAFMDECESVLPEVVVPRVDGVRMKAIKSVKKTGVVKMYVPQSDITPHRAQKLGKYFKRYGGSFHPLEHFDLEDMFGRRQKPSLVLGLDVHSSHQFSASKTDWVSRIQLRPWIFNEGGTTGKLVTAIMVFPKSALIKVEDLSVIGIYSIVRGEEVALEHNAGDRPFYVDSYGRLALFAVNFHKNAFPGTLEIAWTVYADNMYRKTGKTIITLSKKSEVQTKNTEVRERPNGAS